MIGLLSVASRTSALSLMVLLCASTLHAAAFYESTYGVSVTSNVVYGTGAINGGAGTLNLLLDVYQPTVISDPLPDKSPGIVFIHGGSWQFGSKTVAHAVDFANVFASLGYVVTSINYRLLGDNAPATSGPADLMGLVIGPNPELRDTINAGIEDAAKAMGWMRDNAALYNIDPKHIAIGGASAGAVNSLAHAYNNPSPHEAAQAVVSYVGTLAGAESLLDAGEAPALLINSDDDPLVPLFAPQATIDQMNAVGIYNEFYVQTTGVGHNVNFDLVFDGKTLLQHNIEFLAQTLVPEPSSVVLAAFGLIGLTAWGWRRKRSK